MQELKNEKFEDNVFSPIRKRHILPTDRSNISTENIDTGSGSPQFEHTVWRNRGWFEASHTAPFAVGAFFLFVGLIVLGEKRDADMAPIMFLIAIICFITFFPWRALAKTKMQAGIDWSTNTLWIKRKKKVTAFEPDANFIENIGILKHDSKTGNPLWIMDPAMPMVFNKREWFLTVKRVDRDDYFTFKDSVFATKKESKAVAAKFLNILNTQV
ncbi:hypothetical protein ACFLSQ_07095 [Bacteroidota bacterium]